MQQRRLRLGDILDDYCPRERRITNHAVVAMIEDEVKQTRCTTCDAEHEYKHAKVPAPRRKTSRVAAAALVSAEATESATLIVRRRRRPVEEMIDDPPVASAVTGSCERIRGPRSCRGGLTTNPSAEATEDECGSSPLIRATLPRPEGQTPERKPTDFTIRQNSGRFDGERNGNKPRGEQAGSPRSGQGQDITIRRRRFTPGIGIRLASRRWAAGRQSTAPRRRSSGPSSGQRGGRPGQGGGSNRPGQGRGRKRGR